MNLAVSYFFQWTKSKLLFTLNVYIKCQKQNEIDGSMSQSAGAAAIKLRWSSVRLVFTLCGCSESLLDDLRLYLVCKLMSSVRYTEESPRVAMYVKIIFLKELRYSLLGFFVCIGENSRNFVKWFAMVEKQQGQTTEPKRERERFTMATINTNSK